MSAAARLMMTGRRLNALLAELRKRTPLNVTQAAVNGWVGVADQGGSSAPPAPDGRFDETKVYFVSASWWQRVCGALDARTPGAATSANAKGFLITHGLPGQIIKPKTTGSPPAHTALPFLRQRLAAITPRQPSSQHANGYRLTVPGRKPAVLEIETQLTAGYAHVCLESNTENIEDGYVTSRTFTSVCQNGTYTQTQTASGVVQGYGPGETPEDCADISYTDTITPGFDYGLLLSTSTTSVVVPWTEAITEAEGALDDAGEPYLTTYEWPEDDWKAVSAAAPGSIHFLGAANSNPIFPSSDGWEVESFRFRLRNRGAAALRIDWRWIESISEEEQPHTLILRRGEITDWLTPPSLSPWEQWLGTIERIQIARHISPP